MKLIKKYHKVVSNLNLVQGKLQDSKKFKQKEKAMTSLILIPDNLRDISRNYQETDHICHPLSFIYETAKAMHQVL